MSVVEAGLRAGVVTNRVTPRGQPHQEGSGASPSWLSSVPLRWKLLGGFGVVLVVMATVGSWAGWQLRQQDSLYRALLSGEAEGAVVTREMRATLLLQIQSLKNLWLTGRSPQDFELYARQFDARTEDLRRQRARFAELEPTLTAQELVLLQRFDSGWGEYMDTWPRALAAFGGPGGGRLEDAEKVISGKDAEPVVALETLTDSLAARQDAITARISTQAAQTASNVPMVLASASVLGLVVAWLVTRHITSRVRTYVHFVQEVGSGNLTGRAADAGRDELGVLGRNLNTMNQALRDMAGQIREGTANLASATAQIHAAVSQQSSGATEQSAAIAQTTATVEEVKASAEQAAQMAVVVTERAEEANRAATHGVQTVRDATEGMADIREKVESIAENILALSEQTQQIGDIIATVNDLADQSNLLALNAAIEASRAGEHGKGFAVVAAEIRNLAEQSKAATAQVRTILLDIQRATHTAVAATEQGTKGVDVGAQLIDDAGHTIDGLADVIRQTAQSARQIAASVRQHAIGMEQVAGAMTNINQTTVQSLAATSSTQEAAEDLAELAGRLDRLVAQYRL